MHLSPTSKLYLSFKDTLRGVKICWRQNTVNGWVIGDRRDTIIAAIFTAIMSLYICVHI